MVYFKFDEWDTFVCYYFESRPYVVFLALEALLLSNMESLSNFGSGQYWGTWCIINLMNEIHLCVIILNRDQWIIYVVFVALILFWERFVNFRRASWGTFARNFYLGQQFRRYQLKNFIFLASKQNRPDLDPNCLTHPISNKLILKKKPTDNKKVWKKYPVRNKKTSNRK